MTPNRNSSGLLRYFGADVAAKLVGSAFANVVRDAQGGERARPADRQRFQGQELVPASVNSSQYQIALAHMQSRGAAPLAARAMAMVLLDTAKMLDTTVIHLLDKSSEDQLKLVEAETYRYMNLLRDNTSKLSATRPTSNTRSYRARYLIP